MSRVTRIAAVLFVVAVACAASLSTFAGGAAIEPEQRFPIGSQISSVRSVQPSERATADHDELLAGMKGAGDGTVTAADLSSVGGVLVDTQGARLSVFENAKGGVCYLGTRKSFDTPADGQPLAGGCFERLTKAGIQYAIDVRVDGVRIFGVAADDVERVTVTTKSGASSSVPIANNGFVWASADGQDVPVRITATSATGSIDEDIVLDDLED